MFNFTDIKIKKCNVIKNGQKVCKKVNVNGINVWRDGDLIIPNPEQYPASAFVTSTNDTASVRTLTVDNSNLFMAVSGNDDQWFQAKLTFPTNGRKWLNMTYSTTTTKDKLYRTWCEIRTTAGKKIATIIDDQNVMSNVDNATAKVDVSSHSEVTILIYLYVGRGRTRTFTIPNCELTDE